MKNKIARCASILFDRIITYLSIIHDITLVPFLSTYTRKAKKAANTVRYFTILIYSRFG
jgi:hypothetical protein